MDNQESISEFQVRAREAFSFLSKDYGYSELSSSDFANPCSISYINKSVNVRVVVEGIHWGSASRVAFGNLRLDKFQNYDLLELLSATEYTAFDKQEAVKSDQYIQLGMYAALLKNIGGDILNGDLSISDKLDKIREERASA